MNNMPAFAEVIEVAEQLSFEEQEFLMELLRRRAVLAKEIEAARKKFREGKTRALMPAEIIAEALA